MQAETPTRPSSEERSRAFEKAKAKNPSKENRKPRETQASIVSLPLEKNKLNVHEQFDHQRIFKNLRPQQLRRRLLAFPLP